MKKLLAASIVAFLGLILCGVDVGAQGVNVDRYTTNVVVSVSPVTPTLLDAGRGARASLSILFTTNSPAGKGIRFFVFRPNDTNLTLAYQTNAFKAGTIYGNYINPAGTVNSITVPVGWSYDAGNCPVEAIYGISDPLSTGIVSVTTGLPIKP